MGSFNTTCHITNTPILEGQDVRVFFLISAGHRYKGESFNGCGCYAWDNFSIIGLPLKAKYADYNNYEFEDKEMEQYVVDKIKEVYTPNRIAEGKTMEDYNEYHDYMEVEPEELDMNTILDMRHSGSLRAEHWRGVAFINTMAVHEEVYQYMTKGTIQEGWQEDSPVYDVKGLSESLVAKFKNVGLSDEKKELIEKVITALKEGGLSEEELKERREEFTELYSDRLTLSDNRYEYMFSFNLAKDIRDYNSVKVSEAFAGTRFFIGQLSLMNKSLYPEITSGQESNYASDAQRLKELSNIVENLTTPWDDETLPVKTNRSVQYTIDYSVVVSRLVDWYGEEEAEEYVGLFDSFLKANERGVQYIKYDALENDEDADFLHDILPREFHDKELVIM